MVKSDVIRIRTLEIQNRLTSAEIVYVITEFVKKVKPELAEYAPKICGVLLVNQEWYPYYDYALQIYEKELGICKLYDKNKENPSQLGKLIQIF